MNLLKVIGDCPKCAAKKSFGICLVSDNRVIKGCCRCNYTITIELPAIKKKILYLDQCFLSNQYKGIKSIFIEAGKRIELLIHYQQIITPFTGVHEVESLQLDRALFDFIKRNAQGHRFDQILDIQTIQICRSLKQFLNNESIKVDLQESDALSCDIHYWDKNYFYSSNISVENPIETRKNKSIYANQLISLFPKWQHEQLTFNQIYIEEIDGISRFLRSFDWMKSQLIFFIQQESKHDDALKIFDDFLQSDHFCNVPYISIYAALNSKLRQKIQEGWYQNLEKAKHTFIGFPYDAEFISVFGPYCDAMFIDNTMRQWLSDRDLRFADRFNVKLFSMSNFDEFLTWIDELEVTTSEEIRRIVDEIY
jgi:hypothetical protein